MSTGDPMDTDTMPETETEPVTVVFPAFAADTLGETITLTMWEGWRDRVVELAPRFCYGPTFSRGIVENVADMSRCVRDGYSTVAYDYLLAAERTAARYPR